MCYPATGKGIVESDGENRENKETESLNQGCSICFESLSPYADARCLGGTQCFSDWQERVVFWRVCLKLVEVDPSRHRWWSFGQL